MLYIVDTYINTDGNIGKNVKRLSYSIGSRCINYKYYIIIVVCCSPVRLCFSFYFILYFYRDAGDSESVLPHSYLSHHRKNSRVRFVCKSRISCILLCQNHVLQLLFIVTLGDREYRSNRRRPTANEVAEIKYSINAFIL